MLVSPDKPHQIRLIDKIPPPLPILKPSRLPSEKFKSFLQLGYEPITANQHLSIPKPLGHISKQTNVHHPFKKISDLLAKPQKIIYNILGESYGAKEESFGFQYYGEEKEQTGVIQDKGSRVKSSIQFESRFQSGNLLLAYQQSENEYLLIVRPDYNTLSFCQWFYFEVGSQSQENMRIKFSIINMTKSSSLFSKGMKIMALSSFSQQWIRAGEDISYSKNNLKRFNTDHNYYTLTWTMDISPKQRILMAYSLPYSFTALNKDLDSLQESKYVKRSIVARSLLDNRIDLITISSRKNIKDKDVVIITARTHPVETVSSYVMKGVIDYLISEQPQAQLLRQKFIFKLIPMLNPDGVIHGNSRCTLGGVDPNRHWSKPSENATEVLHLKKFILKHRDKLVMYVDLHGHSKKKNIFTYGCNDRNRPLASREFPFILSKLFDAFSFQDCNFKMNKYKQGTARIALWQALKLPNIFTLESSFCSSQKSDNHLDQEGYRAMGTILCRAINICFSDNYCSDENAQHKLKEAKSNIIRQLQKSKRLMSIGMNDCESSQSQEEDTSICRQIETHKNLKLNFSSLKLGEPESVSLANQSINESSRYRSDHSLQDNKINPSYFKSKHKLFKRASQTCIQNKSKSARSQFDHRTTITEHNQHLHSSNSRFKITSRHKTKLKDVVKLQTPRPYFTKRIINFDFANKFQGQQQKINKMVNSRIKQSESWRHGFQSMVKTVKKDNFLEIVQSKLKPNQSNSHLGYRKRHILSRLEICMKRIDQFKK